MRTFIKGKQLTADSRKLVENTIAYGQGISFLVKAIQCSPAEAFDVINRSAKIIGNTNDGNLKIKHYNRNTKKIKNHELENVIKNTYKKFFSI